RATRNPSEGREVGGLGDLEGILEAAIATHEHVLGPGGPALADLGPERLSPDLQLVGIGIDVPNLGVSAKVFIAVGRARAVYDPMMANPDKGLGCLPGVKKFYRPGALIGDKLQNRWESPAGDGVIEERISEEGLEDLPAAAIDLGENAAGARQKE